MLFIYNVGTPVTYSNRGKQMMRNKPATKNKEKRYPAKVTGVSPVTIEFEGTNYPQGSKTMRFSSMLDAEDALSPRNSGGKRKQTKTRKQTRKARKGTYRNRR